MPPTIDNLVEYGLVRHLARLPGRKEPRYGQRLCEVCEQAEPTTTLSEEKMENSELSFRMDRMEQVITDLQREPAEIRHAIDRFRKQFE